MKYLLLLFLLFVSCNKGAPNYTILQSEIGSETVNLERMPIKRAYEVQAEPSHYIDMAIAYWDLVGVEGLVGYNNGGKAILIEVVPTDYEMPLSGVGNAQADALTYYHADKCKIKIRESAVIFENFLILSHEIGHCLGFNHSTNPRSMMYKEAAPSHQMTSEIIRLVRENLEEENVLSNP